MKKNGRLPVINSLRVVNPCSRNVNGEMKTLGEGVAFCEQCTKHVYDLSKFTKTQAKILYFKNGGRLCCKITRKLDGSIKFKQPSCNLSPRQILQRLVFCLTTAFIVLREKLAFSQSERVAQHQNTAIQKDFTSIESLHSTSDQTSILPINSIDSPYILPIGTIESDTMELTGDVRIVSPLDRIIFFIEGALPALLALISPLFSGIFTYLANVSEKKKYAIFAFACAGFYFSIFIIRNFLFISYSYAERGEIEGTYLSSHLATWLVGTLSIFCAIFLIGIIIGFAIRRIYNSICWSRHNLLKK